MHHLDVVARPLGPDPVAARGAVGNLGRDGLEDWLDVRPRVGIAAGHDRGALECPFFAAGDARADIKQSLGFQFARTAGGVGKMRVAAVDQNVARLEQRGQLVDHVIDRKPRLDHDHDLPRRLERRDQVHDRMRADDLLPLGSSLDERVDLGGRTIEHGDGESVALHVQDEVFTHHGQADQADVGGLRGVRHVRVLMRRFRGSFHQTGLYQRTSPISTVGRDRKSWSDKDTHFHGGRSGNSLSNRST